MAVRNPGTPCILANSLIEDYVLSLYSNYGTDPEFPLVNLGNRRTCDRWISAGTYSPTIVGIDDVSVNGKKITSWAIFNHNLKGCTVVLRDDISGVYGGPYDVGSPVALTSNNPYVQYFDEYTVLGPRIGLHIQNPTSPVSLGVFMLANHIELPYCVEMPFEPDYIEAVTFDKISQRGVLLGRDVKYKQVRFNGTVSLIERSWVVNNLVPLYNEKAGEIWAFSWNNLLEPENVRLVTAEPAELIAPLLRPGQMDWNFNFIGTNGEPVE